MSKECPRNHKALFLFKASWSIFLWWFLLHFLLSWRGLCWAAGSSLLAAAVSVSDCGGFHEVEIALERMGTLSGALVRKKRKRCEKDIFIFVLLKQALALGRAKQE